MKAVITWLGTLVADLPLPLLEVWGRFSYVLGLTLACFAFGGFTFRIGPRWGLARERQAWDAKAFLSIPLTFVAILVSGWIGSFIVLVPGAQTFESLKDLVVFLCIVLLGKPALITVPFAYALSDLIEGIPPDFLLAWLPGYFINPACFWVAYQLIGKDPDFRKLRTWGAYLLFVGIFMGLEPVLWGYVCSDKFPPVISYQAITPALFFTTGITWILSPIAMLGALPLARRVGMFWAEIPGHVRERALGRSDWAWEAGTGTGVVARTADTGEPGSPIRMLILGPFVALVLLMVGATAYVTLRSARDDANRLASRLHQEISENINLQLDAQLAGAGQRGGERAAIDRMLAGLPIAEHGRAFILDRRGQLIGSSATRGDAVVADAIAALRAQPAPFSGAGALQLRFDHVTAEPLSRVTWLTHARAYRNRDGAYDADWLLITTTPESFYLAGIHRGNSRSAMVFALALLLALAVAGAIASIVANPLRRIALATQALARGDLAQRVPSSRLEELDALGRSFNRMAEQLAQSFESLRTSEDRLQLATRAANLGIWDWDVQNDRLLWDDAMYRLYGVDKREFSGALEAWKSRVAPEDFARASGDVEAALRGEREFFSEFRVALADGSSRFLRGVGQTIRAPDGRPVRMVGINWDVSEQLRAEQELRRHRDHLEDLVRERTEQAEAASRAKSAFLANMSHEIRTPMNAVLGFGQLLEREAALSPRDRDRLAKMLASGQHLLALINNVLEMSKIEAGRMVLSAAAFDLHAAIADVDAMVRHGIEHKGLTFAIECAPALPRYVRGDAPKLRQVLLNLLGNATKFTHHGGVSLRAGAQLDGRQLILRCEVQDSGEGIAAEELAQVFEPFEQSASGLRAQTGTGLGVPISRTIARMMGGDLTVRSAVGVGTTFVLEARMELASVAEVPPGVRQDERVVGLAPGQKTPRVLVVDDEPDNRLALSELLQGVGIEVVEAENGAVAVQCCAELALDLVFMDMKMPVLDGLEATRRIRAGVRGAQLPIVMLSASVLDGERASALRTQADAFIAKPFSAAQIWRALEQYAAVVLLREGSPASDGSTAPLTRAQVAALGPVTVSALRDALETGYLDRVPAVLAGAGQEHAPVVAAVSKLAADFEIETLIALL